MDIDYKDIDYYLPEELIAERPLERRENAGLLVIDRKRGIFEDKVFTDIVDFFEKDDLLIFNNSKVMKARLIGNDEKGKSIEILLVESKKPKEWLAMVKNSKKIKNNTRVFFSSVGAYIRERNGEGLRKVEFDENVTPDILEKIGLIPIPPYIVKKRKKMDISPYFKEDEYWYQPIMAKNWGSVAAPTASLHFSEKIIEDLKRRGVKIAYVTLHVGIGTFKPIDNPETFKIHKEWISVEQDTVDLIKIAKTNGKKIVAVGTTVMRTLESVGLKFGDWKYIEPFEGYTDLFIKPGFEFRIVDRLITNFHMPRSTLLLLVYAFGGTDLMKKAYEYAIDKKYRFFSYGDAMFLI